MAACAKSQEAMQVALHTKAGLAIVPYVCMHQKHEGFLDRTISLHTSENVRQFLMPSYCKTVHSRRNTEACAKSFARR